MGTARTETASRPLRLAVAAPVFAAAGHPDMRTPSLETASWQAVLDAVRTAESLGNESAWFSDHLFHGRGGEFFESWTAMCVAAGATQRIRLVSNHLGIGLRDARVLAKMATSLASITSGRLDLFIAKGYREREYRSYGLPWEPGDTRTRRLAEAVDVIDAMWRGVPVDFEGEFYTLRDALAAPSHGDRPFVWLGGPLDDTTAALIARRADGWNSFPLSVDAYRAAAARVDHACGAVGRDPRTLRRSLETQVLVLENDAQWPLWLSRWRAMRDSLPMGAATSDLLRDPAELDDALVTEMCRSQFIVGTRDEVVSRLRAYQDAGVTDLVCWFMDAPSDASMRALVSAASDLVTENVSVTLTANQNRCEELQ